VISAEDLDWMCPVCGSEYMHTDDIEVDGLILNILDDLNKENPEGTVRSINLKSDGTWEHVNEDPSMRLPMRRKKRARLTLAQINAIAGIKYDHAPVDLESSESDVEPQPVNKKASEVIDLDSD
jgi:hypothetical protein